MAINYLQHVTDDQLYLVSKVYCSNSNIHIGLY